MLGDVAAAMGAFRTGGTAVPVNAGPVTPTPGVTGLALVDVDVPEMGTGLLVLRPLLWSPCACVAIPCNLACSSSELSRAFSSASLRAAWLGARVFNSPVTHCK